MGENSKIEWTHHTFNPWWGCVKVAPECDYCYADTFSNRLGFKIWGQGTPRRQMKEDYWNGPLAWDIKAFKAGERRRVFCGSMCDVMEDREDLQPYRERLYDVIERTPSLDWLLLTKRPQNFRRFLPKAWLENPRPHVWLMTSCGHPDSSWRVVALRETPAAIRGVSAEPLLGSPTFRLDGIHWVIAGGESGPGARPMHPNWVCDLRDRCQAAGVAFHFKQWGEWTPEGSSEGARRSIRLTRAGRNGQDLANAEDGGDVWMHYRGKKATGRILDGRTWDEFPSVAITQSAA